MPREKPCKGATVQSEATVRDAIDLAGGSDVFSRHSDGRTNDEGELPDSFAFYGVERADGGLSRTWPMW